MHLCECNTCGLETKPGRRYIHGHHAKTENNPSHQKKLKEIFSVIELPFCQCGVCGMRVTKKGFKYRRGHSTKGRILSQHTRDKIGLGNKCKKISVETRRKMSESRSLFLQTEEGKELRKKRSENLKGSGNPMFGKPPSENAYSAWSGWYKGFYNGECWTIHFRSKLEVKFFHENKHLRFKSAEREEHKISWFDGCGNEFNYFMDAIGDCPEVENQCYEIKPVGWKKFDENGKLSIESQNIEHKKNAAIKKHGDKYHFLEFNTVSNSLMCELYDQGIIISFDKPAMEKYNKYKKKQRSKQNV